MTIIAAYIRISSVDQHVHLQEKAIAAWAKSKNVEEKLTTYYDKFTGTTMERPGWRKLERDIDAGKVGTLVVWKLDRLGRTASGLTQLFDKLIQKGIRFISLTESLDLGTHMGKLIAQVLAAVAEYETEARRERQAAGIAAAKARGVKFGGYAKGWTKLTAQQIEIVKTLQAANTPIVQIASACNVSSPTIVNLLNRMKSGEPLPTPRQTTA